MLANDNDPDGDLLTIVSVPSLSEAGAELTLNSDGSIIYNPPAAFNSLHSGKTLTDTFTYTVSDGHGGTSTATVTLTITAVEPPAGLQAMALSISSIEGDYLINSTQAMALSTSFIESDTGLQATALSTSFTESDPRIDTTQAMALSTSFIESDPGLQAMALSTSFTESDPGLQAMALSTSSTESDPLIDSIDAGYDESSLRNELDLDRRLPGKVTELAFLQAALLIQDSSTLNIPLPNLSIEAQEDVSVRNSDDDHGEATT